MKPILISGFEAFADQKINPSEQIVRSLSHIEESQKIILPVSYEKSYEKIRKIIQIGKVKDVIMLGQAGGRSFVSLERVALNWVDADLPDADGKVLLEQKILPLSESAYFTEYPLRQWLSEAEFEKLPIEISNTAGAYVCNYLSYRVAQEFSKQGVRSIFIHLPLLPEQTAAKNVSSMPFQQMLKCVNFIIDRISVMP